MMQNFFDMGGYAEFVWPAYAVAAVILIGLLAVSVTGLRRRQAALAKLDDGSKRERRT